MAKKKQYTVRVSYKVYEYYDVDATSEEKAIEKALEKAGDDSLNDFMQEGDGEGVVTIINGKPTEPKRDDEPEKVWVLFDESLYDYELQGRCIMVFKSEDDARKKFKEFADESRKTAEDNGWVIGSDSDDFFEAYPDGSWGTSHETVELSETTFSEAIWCHD